MRAETIKEPGDVDLLRTEMAMLWDMDDYGRLHHRAHHLVLGVARDGCTAAIGADTDPDLAEALRDLAGCAERHPEPGRAPEAVLRCEELLRDRIGEVELSSVLSYLVHPGITAESAAEVTRSSDGAVRGSLRRANPGTWAEGEWHELLDGSLGPWAIAARGERVAAICFTPAFSSGGAEAGVWTHPDFRGQGHAASVTAHWASEFTAGDRRLFYSTTPANAASRRVAERLRLHHLGWIWKLSRPGEQGSHVQRAWRAPTGS